MISDLEVVDQTANRSADGKCAVRGGARATLLRNSYAICFRLRTEGRLSEKVHMLHLGYLGWLAPPRACGLVRQLWLRCNQPSRVGMNEFRQNFKRRWSIYVRTT